MQIVANHVSWSPEQFMNGTQHRPRTEAPDVKEALHNVFESHTMIVSTQATLWTKMSDKGRAAVGTLMLFISFNCVHSGLSLASVQRFKPLPYLMCDTPFVHVSVGEINKSINRYSKSCTYC